MSIVQHRAPHAPTVGASIIVKNAEETLGTTLQSLRGVVDQVVVVDTGSTDDTPRVATRMGAELYFHPWNDNFSDARNAALAYMRTDFVLVIDADEYLDKDSREIIWSLPNAEQVGGYRVRIVSALSNTTEESIEHRYPRLFRRHPAIRFRGIIHEQVSDAINEAGFTIEDTDVIIYHDGYRNVSAEKRERNMQLLNKQQQLAPDDHWTAYHRGMTAFSAGDHSLTMTVMEPLRHSPALAVEQREFAALRYAQSALATDQFELAIGALAQPMSDINREGLRFFVLGAASASMHDFSGALSHLEQAARTSSTMVDQTTLQSYIQALRSALA